MRQQKPQIGDKVTGRGAGYYGYRPGKVEAITQTRVIIRLDDGGTVDVSNDYFAKWWKIERPRIQPNRPTNKQVNEAQAKAFASYIRRKRG